MVGTKAGGSKAAKTNRKKYGDTFYKLIGSKGGQVGHTGGFAANPELARRAGSKGGKASRRGPAGEEKEPKKFIWEHPIEGVRESLKNE